MAKYKFHQKSYHGDRMIEKGEEVDLPASVKPGPHMEPLDDEAVAAAAAGGIKFTGEVPDVLGVLLPIYETALSKNREKAELMNAEVLAKAFADALDRVFGGGKQDTPKPADPQKGGKGKKHELDGDGD